MGISTATLKFKNDWREYRSKSGHDYKWEEEFKYLTLTEMDYTQQKPYKSDGMNNFATNTKINPYPDLIEYWNFHLTDEVITVNWTFYTYIDNWSFWGGLLDFYSYAPIFFVALFTFRNNEINVLYYQEILRK